MSGRRAVRSAPDPDVLGDSSAHGGHLHTLQGVQVGSGLHPTLWRTCRVLAGRRRLALLRQVALHPGARVKDLAARARCSEAVASQELRRLQARGLIRGRRCGCEVNYRLTADAAVTDAVALVPALRSAILRLGDRFADVCFRMATAFTHPRRIAVVRALAAGPLRSRDLRIAARMPETALFRHMAKLRRRGLVHAEGGWNILVLPRDPLGRALVRQACRPR